MHHAIIHLALFFDIVATDSEAFFVACNHFEESTLIKLGALQCKELSHSLLHFGIDLEVTSLECVFQCKEQVKVRWGKIGTVGRVIQSLPPEATKLILCESCCECFCVVVQEHNTFIQEPWSLSSNGGSEFGEGVAVMCCIDVPLMKEIKENHTFHFPEHCGHNLSCGR